MALAPAAACTVVAATLMVAAIGKAFSFSRFREQLADYQLIEYALTAPAAIGVILAEAVAGLALLAPGARQVGAGSATVLFTLFVAAQSRTMREGRDLQCGCFGGSGPLDTVGVHSLVRTSLFLVMAVVALVPGEVHVSVASSWLALYLALLVFLVSELTRLLGEYRRRTAALTTTTTLRIISEGAAEP